MTPTISLVPQRLRALWPAFAALIVAVLVLSACSGDSFDSSGDSESGSEAQSFDDASDGDFDESMEVDDAMEDDDAMAEEAMEDTDFDEATSDELTEADEGETQTAANRTGITPADLGRKIIFTGYVEVDVDNVAAAGAEAVAAIEGIGGFVFGQESQGGSSPQSIYTFKVRPADFDRAIERLGGIGDLVSQSVSADDVTERVVDLQSRIDVAQLGVDRLRAALEGSETLEDYAELERLLLSRESDLEVMRGQLRTLEDRVDLATITLVLNQDRVHNDVALRVTFYETHDQGASCPADGGRSGVEEGIDITVCYEILNEGDQPLTEIALTDPGLEIDGSGSDKLIEVFGDIGDTLEPGQSLIVAVETTPERDVRLLTKVTARPISGETGDPAGPPVTNTDRSRISVYPSQETPGFTDGFDGGVAVVKALWVAISVTVGFLILPVLVLLPVLLVLGWWIRRRSEAKRAALAASPPPPPSHVVPPAGASSAETEAEPKAHE